MKYLIWVSFLFIANAIYSQKYALLDEHFTHPIKYADKVTSSDRFNGLFPVEKKILPEFLKTLKKIDAKLSSGPPFGAVKNYEMGCIKFIGSVTTSSGKERIDYVIASTCDNVRISMHLCDAKMTPSGNAFYVKVFIKYIEQNIQQ